MCWCLLVPALALRFERRARLESASTVDLSTYDNMEPGDEHLIECYIRYPDTLDASTQCIVEACIRDDAAARTTAAFYRAFYDELDELGELDHGTRHRLEVFVGTLCQPPSPPMLRPRAPRRPDAAPAPPR